MLRLRAGFLWACVALESGSFRWASSIVALIKTTSRPSTPLPVPFLSPSASSNRISNLLDRLFSSVHQKNKILRSRNEVLHHLSHLNQRNSSDFLQSLLCLPPHSINTAHLLVLSFSLCLVACVRTSSACTSSLFYFSFSILLLLITQSYPSFVPSPVTLRQFNPFKSWKHSFVPLRSWNLWNAITRRDTTNQLSMHL